MSPPIVQIPPTVFEKEIVLTTKLKVATDISILGERFDGLDPSHGVFNVTEQLLRRLCQRDDLEITAVGLYGQDPLASSIKSLLYLEHSPALACSFQNTFSVDLGLTKLYARVFHASLSGEFDRMPAARRAFLRSARAVLYRLAYQYRGVSVRRTFDSRGFDVFHCPHLDPPAREVTGDLPRVITVYDLIPVVRPDFVPPRVTDAFKNYLAGIDVRRDWVVCISEFTRQEFCEYTGMSPARCFVAPLAAGESFHPILDRQVIAATRASYGIPEAKYFLTLAAPQPRKNLAHLIRSFFRLLAERQCPDLYLVLAGSKAQGWMYEEIFAAVESAPFVHRSRVIFTGYVADQDLPALYTGCTGFIFPSLYEGFGLPPLEAMACGAPVITSNSTSLPEVIGEAGLMVDPTSVDALSEAMMMLLDDENLRLELRHKGITRASEFSWKRCADETVRAYQAATAGR